MLIGFFLQYWDLISIVWLGKGRTPNNPNTTHIHISQNLFCADGKIASSFGYKYKRRHSRARHTI